MAKTANLLKFFFQFPKDKENTTKLRSLSWEPRTRPIDYNRKIAKVNCKLQQVTKTAEENLSKTEKKELLYGYEVSIYKTQV